MDPPLPPIEVTVDEPASSSPGDSGAAPEQLFFIHGWPDSAALWDEQVAFFVPRGYRCLRVTMPHYHGRETADAAGDLLLPSHVDWGAATQRLAEALREHGGGKPVTLVIHDWGSVWGFYLQLLAPDLVKGIVAMDVGPWALSGRWRNVPAMLAIGLVYQYWLATAHIIGRASSSAFGQGLADWMTRAFARLAKRSARPPPTPHPTPPLTRARAGLGEKGAITEAVTSDAAYPYYYIHRNFVQELLGLQVSTTTTLAHVSCKCMKCSHTALSQAPLAEELMAAANVRPPSDRRPSCPCLFFWGTSAVLSSVLVPSR